MPLRRLTWIRRLWWALPVAAAAAVYLNTLGSDFVWDDMYLILEDHAIKSLRYLDVLFTNDFFGHREDDLVYGYYRPVVSLTYALDWALWHAEPFGFHLSNILWHCAATGLVLLLSVQLGIPKRWAAAGATLFAVHPMHTENVAWISGRTDTVAFVLALAAMVLHLRAEGRMRHLSIAFGALLFTASLGAKEMAVVLLPWIFSAELHVRKRSLREAAVRMVPYGVALVGYALWRFVIVDVAVPFQPPDRTLLDRLLIAPWIFVRYLAWLLVPVGQSAYVQNPYISGPLDPRLYVGFSTAAAAVYGLVRLRRDAPDVAFWGAAFLLSLGPILNFASVSGPPDMGATMAERFLYFPSFPFVGFLAALAVRYLPRQAAGAKQWAAAAVGVVVIGLLSGATVQRNRVWRNNEVFYRATLDAVPSSLIWCNLAVHYIHLGKWDAAEEALREARKFTKDDYHYISSKALMYVTQHRYEEAIPLQEKVAAEAKRGRAIAYNNLAFLYRKTGDLQRAEAYLQEILDNNRGYADVYFNLAEVHRAGGRAEKAKSAYAEALRRRPDNLRFAAAYGGMLLSTGELSEAAVVFETQRGFHGDVPGLLYNLGVIYKKMKQLERARTLLLRALEKEPGYVKARLMLASVLSQLHRQEEARSALERVINDAPGSPEAEMAKEQLGGTVNSLAPTRRDRLGQPVGALP